MGVFKDLLDYLFQDLFHELFNCLSHVKPKRFFLAISPRTPGRAPRPVARLNQGPLRRIWLSNVAQDLDRPFLYKLKADPILRNVRQSEGVAAQKEIFRLQALETEAQRLAPARSFASPARTHERNETITQLKPSLRKLRLTF